MLDQLQTTAGHQGQAAEHPSLEVFTDQVQSLSRSAPPRVGIVLSTSTTGE